MQRTYQLRKTELTWREVGDAIVILDLSDSSYLSVSGAGRVVWDRLDGGATLAELVAAVMEIFDVSEELAASDTSSFLDSLESRKLIFARA